MTSIKFYPSFLAHANLKKRCLLTALTILSITTLGAPGVQAEIDARRQMMLGNPDKATASADNPEHYLIKRPQYALSYNNKLRFPNWVAWKLDASDIGDEPRGLFAPDPDLPPSITKVKPSAYVKSGYDKGHNCPGKDRTATTEDNVAVFYMSNMTLPPHGLNGGPWAKLEDYSRDQAQAGNSCHIIAVHGFSAPDFKTIGTAKVAVPDFAWKIVVIVPTGKPIDASVRVIAVRMPNISTIIKKPWKEFVVKPSELELATGMRFFGAFPASIRGALLNKAGDGES